MSQFDMDWLLGVVEGGMKLAIFDSRYSDGLVVIMTDKTEHAAAIENNFSGGDTDWEAVSFPLHNLGWFPIVFVEKIDDAIPAIRKKIAEIEATQPDPVKWRTCVEWLGELIRLNKHFQLLYGLQKGNDLCSINKAYEKLGDMF